MPDRKRFTQLGAPELEERIARDLARIGSAIAEELGSSGAALLLGGGYGRGEGGGQKDADGHWHPLNDYDLVAIVRGRSRFALSRLQAQLAALAERLASEVGLEVEISALRTEDLHRLPFTMMWCELLSAPHLLAGEASALATLRPLPPEELPAVEAVRYLANRGALLLWSRLEPLPDARVWKFVAKAWLACGAAALIARRRFEVGYAARQGALRALDEGMLPPVPDLVAQHDRAVSERLRPTPPPSDLAHEVDRARRAVLATWNWTETLRLGWAPPSWEAYAQRVGLFPEPAASRFGLVLRHLRLLGGAGLLPWHATAEHPRARLLRTLPGILAGEEAPFAANWLGGREKEAATRWLELWRRIQA